MDISNDEFKHQLNELRMKRDKLYNKNENAIAKILSMLTGSEYRYIKKCIFMFESEMSEIAKCFDYCVDNKECFVIQILNRSFIEAFFRYMYICISFLDSKSEQEALEYTEILSVSETCTMLQKLKNVLKETGHLGSDIDPFDVISENKISKNKMHEVSKKYSFSNIVLEINRYFEKYFNDFPSIELIKYIVNYSVLSSFMHGGPSAQMRHLFFEDMNKSILDNYKLILNCIQIVHFYMYRCIKEIDSSIDDDAIRIENEIFE